MFPLQSAVDPKIMNRGRKGGWGLGKGLCPIRRKFVKILGKIMHFRAKFSLVLKCIRSIGEVAPLESATACSGSFFSFDCNLVDYPILIIFDT